MKNRVKNIVLNKYNNYKSNNLTVIILIKVSSIKFTSH